MRQVVFAGALVALCSFFVVSRVEADGAAPAASLAPPIVTPPATWAVAPLSAADRSLALTTIIRPSSVPVARLAAPASPPHPLRARFEVSWGTFFTSSVKFKPHIQDSLSVTPSAVWVHKGLIGFTVPAGGRWFIDCAVNDSLAHAAPPPPAATVGSAPTYPPFTVFFGGSGGNEGIQKVHSHNDHVAFVIAPPVVDPFPTANPTGEVVLRVWRPEGKWFWHSCRAEPVD